MQRSLSSREPEASHRTRIAGLHAAQGEKEMNDTVLILAISVIIIGVLILAGLAFWLALDRRRTHTSLQSQPIRQGDQQAPGGQRPAQAGLPGGQRPSPAAPTPAVPQAPKRNQGGKADPAAQPPKDIGSSGEYPAAALYDQTLLPGQPAKRRNKQQSS